MGWVGVVTNGGASLFAQWIQGTTLTITSAASGTGTDPEASLISKTALNTQKQTASLVSSSLLETGVKLKIQLTGHTEAYTLNQIGIWGKIGSGTPALLAIYQNASGVAIPTAASAPDFCYTFFATLVSSNQGTLNITIDPSVYVTEATVTTMISGKEDTANKATTLNSSSTNYPSCSAVKTYADGRTSWSDESVQCRLRRGTALSLASTTLVDGEIQMATDTGAIWLVSGSTRIKLGAIAVTVTLSSSSWSASSPYTQTVSVTGISTSSRPNLSLDVSSAVDKSSLGTLRKEFAKIAYIDTSDGAITFTAPFECPTSNLTVELTGI